MTCRQFSSALKKFSCGLLISGALVAVVGCQDSVSVSNLPGYVTFVGPHTLGNEGVVTWFGVSDPEGDFVAVSVEVCTEERCDVPRLLPGSATIDTLPANADSSSSALKLIWEPDCELLGEDTPFTVFVESLGASQVEGVEGVRSQSTTLAELGFSCP